MSSGICRYSHTIYCEYRGFPIVLDYIVHSVVGQLHTARPDGFYSIGTFSAITD